MAWWLQPATVAFAVPLYKLYPTMKRHALPLSLGVVTGTGISIVSTVLLADILHLTILAPSLAPHSVTTPIAMLTSRSLHGNPTLTAVFVIITALVGVIAGPLIIQHLKIRTSLARGALLGTGAHAMGTSRAFEFGETEGSIASISMILAGILTILFAPLFVPYL